jgi:hypothetical protein
MATQVICDECGEPIDLTQPYFQVSATKVQINNAGDPTTPNEPVVVEITQQFDYHDGHQPQTTTRPEPTHPIVKPDEPPAEPTLTELDPTTALKGSTDTLRVLGTNFMPTAVIVFNGTEVATNFVSDTELTYTLDPALGKNTYNVLVRQDDTDTEPLPFVVA